MDDFHRKDEGMACTLLRGDDSPDVLAAQFSELTQEAGQADAGDMNES